jgi:hypothetical protein
MHRSLAALGLCLVLVAAASSDEPYFRENPDGAPGGLTLIRRGNQTTWSLGGIFRPMRVRVVERTPHGPTTTRLRFPSALHSPVMPPNPGTIRGVGDPPVHEPAPQ